MQGGRPFCACCKYLLSALGLMLQVHLCPKCKGSFKLAHRFGPSHEKALDSVDQVHLRFDRSCCQLLTYLSCVMLPACSFTLICLVQLLASWFWVDLMCTVLMQLRRMWAMTCRWGLT